MLSPNTILQGRYRIIRQLGHGGMGAVYEALNERVSSIVALKETFAETDAQRKAFEQEAKRLANLDHDAFPKVMDHFEEGDGQYLVMELISGNDLAELLRVRESPFAPAKVLEWADQLLDALEVLHSYPIIHRDIKPSNLKLTRRGKIKLLDFGIAKGTAGQMTTLKTDRSGGGYTPHYAPLEQMLRADWRWGESLSIVNAAAVERIRQETTDARSDLYALGATVYHLMTDVIPPDAPARALSIWTGKPDRLRPAHELNPQVSPAVSAVLMQAMALERDERPRTAAELRRMLREAANQPVSVPHTDLSAEIEEQVRQRREAEARRREEEEERARKLEEEARRRVAAEERAQREAEEAARLAAAEQRRREEAEKRRRDEERARLEAEERQRQEAAARAAEQRRLEEEERQRRAAAEQQRAAAEEARRKAAAEEETRRRREEEERRQCEEEERRQREAEAEARRLEEEAARRRAEESTREAETKRAQDVNVHVPTLPAPPPRVPLPDASTGTVATGGHSQTAGALARVGGIQRLMLIGVIGLVNIAVVLAGSWWLLRMMSASNDNQVAVEQPIIIGSSDEQTPNQPTTPHPPPGMAYVPGGEFTMGRDGDDEYERPAHRVTVKPFFIDIHEVTNEEYAKFIWATGWQPPPTWTSQTYPAGAALKPVTGVTWDDARAFARWSGKRLPTEEEWEFAARGTDGRRYPWGNDWRKGLANADGASKGMVNIDTYKGASPFGVLDMVGNAWEWTESKMIPYPKGSLPIKVTDDLKVIRGGSYASNRNQATTTYRRGWRASAESDYSNTGFRCVKDITNSAK